MNQLQLLNDIQEWRSQKWPISSHHSEQKFLINKQTIIAAGTVAIAKINKPALQWFVEQYQFKTSRHTKLQRLGLKQQAVSRGLSTSDRFSRKELSKYWLKRPKYIVRGTPKKSDKTPKMAKTNFEYSMFFSQN